MTLGFLAEGHDFLYKIQHIVRIFYPDITFVPYTEEQDFLISSFHKTETEYRLSAILKVEDFSETLTAVLPADIEASQISWQLSKLVYQLFQQKTGTNPPWGMLVGVRPVQLYQRQLEKGFSSQETVQFYQNRYDVSPEKAQLAVTIGENQQRIRSQVRENGCSVYIGIPFCPTRCSYCSFVSHGIEHTKGLVSEYLECLYQEIRVTGTLLKQLGLKVQSIYIGGGTPTTLSGRQLSQLLETVEKAVPTNQLKEYTVEAGRPDTITKEKLEVLRSFPVSRISINPQTLNPQVLEHIGRKHTVEEFYRSFYLARETGFSQINTDLIAGLPQEEEASFLSGLEQILLLEPENVTIHTLTLKRSSALKERWEKGQEEPEINLNQMLSTSQQVLAGRGYVPYYLYRQKKTRQNLENVGYSKPGAESYYNVAMMEDLETVIGLGAGSTTKIVSKQGTIQRIYNFKYPYEYIGNFQEILHRKEGLKEYYERTSSNELFSGTD